MEVEDKLDKHRGEYDRTSEDDIRNLDIFARTHTISSNAWDSDAESESDPGETDRDEDRAETSGEERGDPKMVWINEGQLWV